MGEKLSEEAIIPKTFWEYIKSWGPGIAAVLSWAGAGDVVDCSTAGASYGWALLWTMTLALVFRGVITSIMAKYELCNPHRETLIAGYRRLGRWVPAFIAAVLIIYCFIYGAFLLPSAATGLWYFFGRPAGDWGKFVIAFILMVIAVMTWGYWGKGLYKYVEMLFKVTLSLMVITFVGIAAMSLTLYDLGQMLVSMVTPRLPAGTGPWEASFLVVSVIGAIGGSVANFLYPYFIKGKGWKDERYLKVQRFDLWLAIIVCLFLNSAIWATAASVLYPRGIHVTELTDIAKAFSLVIHPATEYLLYFGFFVTAYDTFVGLMVGQSMAATDALHVAYPERKKKYETYLRDPIYRILIYITMAAAVIWTIPGMPGIIYLVLVGNAFSVVALPLFSIGLLILANKAEWIGEKYKNRWWENILLLIITITALWSTYTLVKSLLKL